MKLRKLSYKDSLWTLNGITFSEVNLLAGKNAVGKSRTIETLRDFVKMVRMQQVNRLSGNMEYELLFVHEGKELLYSFRYENGVIVSEQLTVDNECFLQRDKDSTLLKTERINPPKDRLTLHVRRDLVEYPFFELLVQWCEGFYGLYFNKEGKSFQMFYELSVPDMFIQLDPAACIRLIDQLNKTGFQVKEVVAATLGTTGEKTLKIKETNIEQPLWFWELSLAMQRTLRLLVFIEYLTTQKKPLTVVIDDFCEGLDYDRSIKLGKQLFSFCLAHSIQLIVTSNDNILMDGIELKYWNILQRQGSVVTAVSKETHPRLFDDFAFTGLSNFDFFSSDYLSRHTK